MPGLVVLFFVTAFTRATIACHAEVNNIETACTYNSLTVYNRHNQVVKCGAKMEKNDWKFIPSVAYPHADHKATYTLVMQDADVPLPFVGPVLVHWLVANIPGADLARGDISRGNILYGYIKPSPPPFSGNHRYMFLLYKELKLSQTIKKPRTRYNFKQIKWIIRQKPGICGPVAGTMFLASN